MKRLRFAAAAFAATFFILPIAVGQTPPPPTEAPAGFDDAPNGLVSPGEFTTVRGAFDSREDKADGLGPVYNAQACGECHQNPTSGGISQTSELRAGHFDGVRFVEHPGGSLIQDRSIDPAFQERVLGGNEVRSFRTSLNVLGDGFVEAIDSNALLDIANRQPPGMRGQLIQVPVLEAPGAVRAGRFGWKNQHASLLSFSADAYLNEMGITSRLQPVDNTSNGRVVDDGVDDPEDEEDDIDAFTLFMRASKVPPRDAALAATPDAGAGSLIFSAIGCSTCHVRSITTAPAGTAINGGTFVVPEALGNKVIHPFSDFLLHDVGTGDGIVQNGPPSTRNKVRTAPLWGMRTRGRLMHDGLALSRNEAILRHRGEAFGVMLAYRALPAAQKNQLIAFLNSL